MYLYILLILIVIVGVFVLLKDPDANIINVIL